MNDETHDAILVGTCFTWGLIAIVIASILGSLVYLSLYTNVLNLKREAVQHSNQYVQSKVTELVDSYNQYQTIETQKNVYVGHEEVVDAYSAQQQSIILRMCNAFYLIPPDVRLDEVPDYIQGFLNGECHE